ncbi:MULTISPECIES: hypothetical protein [Streptomyces]|uniref:Uncharacterized protein n=3 Tax=Streptomyces rimosus TaxID=1927 RepID=A0A8A1V2B0_STRR1|nr:MULTISPECIES: hypothetical protein [Streptomyces]KOG73150.1 hypothetical protein ADK78_18065 [Kitasatospora aureofaciens]MYT41979.1 hypothetical protein [Streptomyces sp. SID5471]KEF04928.1 hypothetical protein DF17_22085 [Streptomyces rimosus]KEF12459.1 hypothetical protein DF18_35620 [Streptomyces rimosus]KOT38691.1 hypothetical protein ADK42_17340 [Streptomyces rimosus subsp. rimosus]
MDIEQGDGSTSRPFPPTEWELRRRAAQQAVDEARLVRPVLAHPPTAAERRIVRELHRSIAALEAAWDAPDRLPPLAHRLHLLVQAGQCVRALADLDSDPGELEQHLREALEAVAVMCGAFDTRLIQLETHLQRRSAPDQDGADWLERIEQELHPPGGAEGTCWWDAQGARYVLTQMREGLLALIVAP